MEASVYEGHGGRALLGNLVAQCRKVVGLTGLLMLSIQAASAADVCTLPSVKAPLDIACSMPTDDDEDTATQYGKALQLIRSYWAVPLDWQTPNPASESIASPTVVFATLRFLDDSDREVIKFYINRQNLYVVGYEIGGTYYAIMGQPKPGEKPSQVVDLKFEGSYQGLESAGLNRDKINYGWQTLTSSLRKLVLEPLGGTDGVGAKKALLVVIPMFMEGARFQYSIGRDIEFNIKNYATGRPVQGFNKSLMDNWSKLSVIAFNSRAGKKVVPLTITGTLPNGLKNTETFDNYNGVTGSLGILLTQKK